MNNLLGRCFQKLKTSVGKQKINHGARFASIIFVAILLATQMPVAAISPEKRRLNTLRGISFLDDPPVACGVTGLGPSLDGHTLPAGFGGTGFEEPINELGQVPSTDGYVTFSGNVQNASTEKNIPDPHDPGKKVSMQDLYRSYYVTMRWRYALWNWDGSAVAGKEDVGFYGKAPKLLITNPRTGKSIIAVVLEAGPAPWTGVDRQNNNAPKQGWVNPQDGTPAYYKGRVSGFPPQAIADLEATMRMYDGSGDDLVYTWAPDQNALPGPYNGKVENSADTVDSSCPVLGLPIGEYIKDTSSMTCQVGTDGGIADGYAGGKLYKIRLCIVRGFRVNVLIERQVDGLLNTIESPGNDFGGGAFRTMEQQIALRTTNGCPNVYEADSMECRVPTARPGYSNHQMGLAIDFTYNGSLIQSHSNNGFKLLSLNAGNFGLQNFPAEAWHWSVDGR